MVFGGSSDSTFDSSFIGALYGDKDDEDDGCCSKCCQRYPWPSITAGVFILVGICVWCTTVTKSSGEVIELFGGTVAEDEIDRMFAIALYATYGATAFMVILGSVLIAIGCLATGAVRKYHICRFRSRVSAIFQTTMFLIITYIVLLGWLGVVIVSMFPLVFFTVQHQGNCQVDDFTINTCIDLKQWGFYDEGENGADELCKNELKTLCEGNLRLLFFMATMSAVLICVGLAQFLATLSYNSAKLRHRYTSHNRGKTGSYNLRASYRAGSYRSTRNNQYRASSRENVAQPKYNNPAPYQSQDSIDRLKREYMGNQSRERLPDEYSHQGSREWDNQEHGGHEMNTISTFYGGEGSASTMRYDRDDSYDGRNQSNQYHREYHI